MGCVHCARLQKPVLRLREDRARARNPRLSYYPTSYRKVEV